ncbi:Fe-S cluster assembly protein HesB [Enhygromyxa salina]|uniref:Fe-S cluster assembly protein HesB n=1 Tax=Enhygromyxa salina TaxID=215803 RepID=UPI000D025C84|nr:Fe-S cluster assembly protein HesB [Enhygromyxa salina]
MRVPEPFELDVVLRGHGWVALAPHVYDRERIRWSTTVDLSAVGARGPVVDLDLRQRDGAVLEAQVRARAPLDRTMLARVREALVTSLALDFELEPFWARCADTPRLAWVQQRGAGRLLRSPTLFEDLLKLLMTTNCSWANTESMVTRTTSALGRRGPSGRHAFPSARACARQDEAFWRDVARVGYRASHCRALAQGFASGQLSRADFDDPSLATDEVRRRLLALPGFGPYAAGQALRLLGRFDDLALDSWVRSRAAELHGLVSGDASGSDRAIAACYAEFDEYAGLALWMDVTRAWHTPGSGED